jgi:hypothetical protein
MYHIAFDIENSTNVFKHHHNDDTKFALACCIFQLREKSYDYRQTGSRKEIENDKVFRSFVEFYIHSEHFVAC